MSAATEAVMSSTKAAKILKRTLVGGSLVVVVGSILWWTSRSGDFRPVFWTCAILLIAAVFETSRMGRLARANVRPVLLVAALGALTLALQGIAGARTAAEFASIFPPEIDGMRGVHRATLPAAYAWVFVLACASFGSLHTLTRVAPRSDTLARTFGYIGFGAVIVFALGDTEAVTERLPPAFVVLAVLALTTLPVVAIDRAWTRLALAVGLALWLIPPLPALWQVWAQWGIRGLIALLLLSKIGDTAGYYVGNAIGKSHPFPKISPGKTTAGCVASFVTATAVGGLLMRFDVLPRAQLGIVGGFLAGAVVNLAAQAGDLFESFVKRRAGVKDSSTAFGPSGGVLDQIDSLLFSIPAAVIAWPWIFTTP